MKHNTHRDIHQAQAMPNDPITVRLKIMELEQRFTEELNRVEKIFTKKLNRAEERNTALEKRYTALEERNTALEERNTAVEFQLTKLQQQLTQLQQQLTQPQQQVNNMTRQVVPPSPILLLNSDSQELLPSSGQQQVQSPIGTRLGYSLFGNSAGHRAPNAIITQLIQHTKTPDTTLKNIA